jgi:hypothetical protein
MGLDGRASWWALHGSELGVVHVEEGWWRERRPLEVEFKRAREAGGHRPGSVIGIGAAPCVLINDFELLPQLALYPQDLGYQVLPPL